MNKDNPAKGDKKNPDLPQSPVQFSHAGRPLRKTTDVSYGNVVEPDVDSDNNSDFIKSPSRKHNKSKPCALGPSASRVVAQNKRTGTPGTILLSTMGVYTRSESPEYSDQLSDGEKNSVSSSGSSRTFKPDLSDGASTDTFDRFDDSDVKPKPKKGTKHCTIWPKITQKDSYLQVS